MPTSKSNLKHPSFKKNAPPEGCCEKRCEIQGGGQKNGCDGRLMAKILFREFGGMKQHMYKFT